MHAASLAGKRFDIIRAIFELDDEYEKEKRDLRKVL